VLMAYVAFATAEEAGASGVLAVVTAGLYTGWRSHEIYDADRRLNAAAFWEVLVLSLNAIIFILLGLQFPGIVDAVAEQFSAAQIVVYGLLVAALVIAVRIVWQFLPEALGRVYGPAGALSTGGDWRERLAVGWSGMRGAVSLAAALAIPLELDNGQPFTDRDLVIYLTVAVIAATLVLQGLTLPALISRLGLSRPRLFAPDEAVARLAAAQSALDRLDELEQGGDPVPDVAVDRLRELYQARFARCVASLQGDDRALPVENPLTGYRELRRDLIQRERAVLLQMRNENRLKVDVLRRLERELDLDEARLQT
jgi:monovalent cation/hydrogen antiporter